MAATVLIRYGDRVIRITESALKRYIGAGWVLVGPATGPIPDPIPEPIPVPSPDADSNTRVMSAEQRRFVGMWCRGAMNQLQLRDWTLHINAEPPDDATKWAQIATVDAYREAVLWVSAELFNESEGEILGTLVHELIHLFHEDLWSAVADAVKTLDADNPVHGFLDSTMRRYVERAVETTARVVVEHVNLPPVRCLKNAEPVEAITV